MNTFVISLGGSLLVPDQIDVDFLKKFKSLILSPGKKNKFIITIGGGKTARRYQQAARDLGVKNEALDWLGIKATHLNALLVNKVFGSAAHPKIIADPRKKVSFKKILIAAGWKPGFSTDYDAVMLAQTYGVKTVINITNVEYLHDKDPRQYKNTQIIKQTNWKTFRKIVGHKWSPGLNAVFDPIAAQLAQKLKLKLYLIGPDLKNLDSLLKNQKFKGSIIQD